MIIKVNPKKVVRCLQKTASNWNRGDVRTPRVLKIMEDKNDGRAAKKRFNPIAAIKMFAFVFSNKNANPDSINVHKTNVRKNPTTGEPVITENAKNKNAEKEMIPSKNNARRPAYSLKRAPVAANKSGVEKEKTFNSVDKKLLIFFCHLSFKFY